MEDQLSERTAMMLAWATEFYGDRLRVVLGERETLRAHHFALVNERYGDVSSPKTIAHSAMARVASGSDAHHKLHPQPVIGLVVRCV
jgi:hypothetical protein